MSSALRGAGRHGEESGGQQAATGGITQAQTVQAAHAGAGAGEAGAQAQHTGPLSSLLYAAYALGDGARLVC